MRLRKRSIVLIVLLCICVLIYVLFPKGRSLSMFDKRAVWLSYEDLSQLSYESQDAFCDDFKDVVDNVKAYHTNTIIVHVRAFSDALYDSKLFPLSEYICHRQSISFDPLEEMIDIAHDNDLNIEAWINPYRISLNQESYEQFVNYSPKKDWIHDEHSIGYGTHQYIMNPANQEVRDYVVDGVQEIVENYDVDGIHFDDYFYVEGTHGKTTQNERMDYVNMLIQDVYQSIKSINENVTFGISPQGNYENCINEGADVDTWLKEKGFIDYLMPQIYWTNQWGQDGQTSMFSDRVKTFASLKRRSGVMLYAGLALYQAGQDLKMDQGWSSKSSNICEQVNILEEENYNGYSLFNYGALLSEAGQKEMDELLKAHP